MQGMGWITQICSASRVGFPNPHTGTSHNVHNMMTSPGNDTIVLLASHSDSLAFRETLWIFIMEFPLKARVLPCDVGDTIVSLMALVAPSLCACPRISRVGPGAPCQRQDRAIHSFPGTASIKAT